MRTRTSRAGGPGVACLLATLGLAFALALAVPAPARAQEDASKITIKTTRITGDIYLVEGTGGNMAASVGTDGIFLVDTDDGPTAGKIREALRGLAGRRNATPDRLRLILNTHWHHDHTGGNLALGADAPIMAHDRVRARVATPQQTFGHTIEPLEAAAWPIVTFEDSVTVYLNGEQIRIVHYPAGHTDGDAVVFFNGAHVVHVGDLMFAGSFPFVDLGAGGDVEGYARDLRAILARLPKDAKIIPGHGPVSTAADLAAYVNMLETTTGLVRDGMKAGKTLAQLQAEGLPERWQRWSGDFIKTNTWIQIVYESLSRQAGGGSAP